MLALLGLKTTFRGGDCDNAITLLVLLCMLSAIETKFYPSYI